MAELFSPERRRQPALRKVSGAAKAIELVWELAQGAYTSHVTGLLNKAAFVARSTEPSAADPLQSPLVLFVDLSGFKAVNDRFGHAVGDSLLSEVGQTLADAAVDLNGDVYHLSGDEFAAVFLVNDVRSDDQIVGQFCSGLSQISVSIAGTVDRAEVKLHFGYTPRDPDQLLDTLLKRAERAADEAKASNQPYMAWDASFAADEVVSARKKCNCGATTTVQVRKSAKVAGYLSTCGNCQAPLG